MAEGHGGSTVNGATNSSASVNSKSELWRERGSRLLRFGKRLSSTSVTGSKILGIAIATVIWVVLFAGFWEGNAEWNHLMQRHHRRLSSSLCTGTSVKETQALLLTPDCAESVQMVKTRWFSYVVFYAVGKARHVFFPDVSGDSTFIIKQKLVEMVNSQNLFLICLTILAVCYYKPAHLFNNSPASQGTHSKSN